MTSTPLRMLAGSHYISYPKKDHPLGDDAHFIHEEKQVVGVADGVGGWTKRGVDAGEYARQLMSYSMAALLQNDALVDPYEILHVAFSATIVAGSTTVCILALRNRCIHSANVGDSGFLVIRNGEPIYHSPRQVYGFNHPYQLGIASGCQSPSSAERIQLPVESGDVIVIGTDGLFDNMFDHEIACMVKSGRDLLLSPKDLAQNIAFMANINSRNRSAVTPYSTESVRAGRSHRGGKKDDITVVLMYIVESEPMTQQPVTEENLNQEESLPEENSNQEEANAT